jgi:hypothetical protein
MEGARSAPPQTRLKIKRFVPPPVYDREDPEDPSATKLLWSNEAHVAPSIFNLISNEGEFVSFRGGLIEITSATATTRSLERGTSQICIVQSCVVR